MNRNASLDIARLVGAFGIVLFHAGAPGQSIGYAALPFFLISLILLGLNGARTKTVATFATDRAARLLKPWLIWSLIYTLFKLAEVLLLHKSFASEFSATMLVTGTSLHLWFLPFAFMVCLCLPAITRGFAQVHPLAGLALFSGLALISLALQQGPPLPIPLAQWAFGLPAILVGIGFGFAMADRDGLGFACLGLIIVVSLGWVMGWTSGMLQLAVGGGVFLFCLILPGTETKITVLCARTSMTVYLVHPLIMSLLERVAHLHRSSLALALLTMLASFIFAAVVDRFARSSSPSLVRHSRMPPIAKL